MFLKYSLSLLLAVTGRSFGCKDTAGFVKLSNGSKMKCSQFDDFSCQKYAEGPKKCPVTCNACPTNDSVGGTKQYRNVRRKTSVTKQERIVSQTLGKYN